MVGQLGLFNVCNGLSLIIHSFYSLQDISFSENHINQLHQMLLRYSEKDTRHRGNYKTHSNSVAAFDENGAQIGIVFSNGHTVRHAVPDVGVGELGEPGA